MIKPSFIKKVQPTATPSTETVGASQVVFALSEVLGTTYVLYQRSLFYHWNVKGPHFYGLHKLFEAHYEELHQAGDVLAERLRAMGAIAPGTLRDFLNLSAIGEDRETPATAEIMVSNLVSDHEICGQKAKETHDLAKKTNDHVTMDMMVKRMAFHDKSVWMLRSIISDSATEQPFPIERL